jgi:hypothetical protein
MKLVNEAGIKVGRAIESLDPNTYNQTNSENKLKIFSTKIEEDQKKGKCCLSN